MLVSFKIPPNEDIGKCFLSFFFDKIGYSGGAGGKMYAYKLREEIFIGKTTYHGRPRREFGGIVFGIEVWVSFILALSFFLLRLILVFFL